MGYGIFTSSVENRIDLLVGIKAGYFISVSPYRKIISSPLKVFNILEKGNLKKAILTDKIGTIID